MRGVASRPGVSEQAQRTGLDNHRGLFAAYSLGVGVPPGDAAAPGWRASRPRSYAALTASVRLVAPSLVITRDRCTLTVFSLMNNSSPICRLVRPAATNVRTERSRGVSGSEGD